MSLAGTLDFQSAYPSQSLARIPATDRAPPPTFELGGSGDRAAATLAPVVTPALAGVLLIGGTE
jgi:hypothetical protein